MAALSHLSQCFCPTYQQDGAAALPHTFASRCCALIKLPSPAATISRCFCPLAILPTFECCARTTLPSRTGAHRCVQLSNPTKIELSYNNKVRKSGVLDCLFMCRKSHGYGRSRWRCWIVTPSRRPFGLSSRYLQLKVFDSAVTNPHCAAPASLCCPCLTVLPLPRCAAPDHNYLCLCSRRPGIGV